MIKKSKPCDNIILPFSVLSAISLVKLINNTNIFSHYHDLIAGHCIFEADLRTGE
jgi:hypothetical protein